MHVEPDYNHFELKLKIGDHTQNEVESNHTECDQSTCGGFKHMQSTTLPTNFNFLFFNFYVFRPNIEGIKLQSKIKDSKKLKMDKMPSSNSRDIMSESTKCAEQKKKSSDQQQEEGSTVNNHSKQVHYCWFYDPSQCTKAINSVESRR